MKVLRMSLINPLVHIPTILADSQSTIMLLIYLCRHLGVRFLALVPSSPIDGTTHIPDPFLGPPHSSLHRYQTPCFTTWASLPRTPTNSQHRAFAISLTIIFRADYSQGMPPTTPVQVTPGIGKGNDHSLPLYCSTAKIRIPEFRCCYFGGG